MREKKEKSNTFYSDSDELLFADENMTSAERRKRRRTLRLTKKLFRAIDILFESAQNSCPYVAKEDLQNMDCRTDIVYDESNPEVCLLDYYSDKSEDIKPAVILIHGGGFTAGDKKFRRGRAQYLAANGFRVFCVNYGLAPKFLYPAPLKHIVSAANYIYANAQKFKIDGSKILVDGDSAGGYYAAMLGAFSCSDELSRALGVQLDFDIFGLLLNCGVYDIHVALDSNALLSKFYGGVLLSLTGVTASDFDTYEYKDACEPIAFINEKFPPTFVIYSDNDIFCRGQGDVLIEKLREYNVYFESFCAHYRDSNHCFSLTWSGDDAAAANSLMLSFATRLANDKIKLD